MSPNVVDSIDIVIADVTAQPIASKSSESLQRSGEMNLSASNVTIVPRPESISALSSNIPTLQFGGLSLLNSHSLSMDATGSPLEFSVPHGQLPDGREGKESKEVKEYNDEQIIVEALRSQKDRLFMLKLGDCMENLIAERQCVFYS